MAQSLKVYRNKRRAPARAVSPVQRRRAALMRSFNEFDRLFDDLFSSSLLRLGRRPLVDDLLGSAVVRQPSIDLVEHDHEFVLRAEVPGISKEDLDISVDDSSVTLRGSMSEDDSDEQAGDYYRAEIARSEFTRAVTLPSQIDPEQVRASLRDGILELRMPKLEDVRRRKVEIE